MVTVAYGLVWLAFIGAESVTMYLFILTWYLDTPNHLYHCSTMHDTYGMYKIVLVCNFIVWTVSIALQSQ